MHQENKLIPPWGKPIEWQEIHQILTHILSINRQKLTRARAIAQEIHQQLDAVAYQMDDLCLQTCRLCPDVCCLTATVWADFKDLVFWHLIGQAVPLQQNISDGHQACCYLGIRGCTLPRLSRPFLCTWYVCPTQVSRLKTMPGNDRSPRLKSNLQSIKRSRILMENAFIDSVL